MTGPKVLEVPIQGMDCMECTVHVREAISALEGVNSVEVYLAAEKAVVDFDPGRVKLDAIRYAVQKAGYRAELAEPDKKEERAFQEFVRPVLALLGGVFGTVTLVGVVGEWLGLFGNVTSSIP